MYFALLLTFETKAQTATRDNKVSESVTFNDMPRGKNVYGMFEGRSPCEQICKLLGATLPDELDHLKWQVNSLSGFGEQGTYPFRTYD